jgi:hypothetical protein
MKYHRKLICFENKLHKNNNALKHHRKLQNVMKINFPISYILVSVKY